MKGWVYVITNRAMPDLVKVGFSTKDPELRASELNHTGSPHPYVVEYEILIEDPYNIEQHAHRYLAGKREAKEWFRCDPEEAVVAIRQIAGDRIILENFKRLVRQRAEDREKQAQIARAALEQVELDFKNKSAPISPNEEGELPEHVKERLSLFVGPDPDEGEIARRTREIERIVDGAVPLAASRKIAIATSVKLAVNAPKDNVVAMILSSHPSTISAKVASSIFDAMFAVRNRTCR